MPQLVRTLNSNKGFILVGTVVFTIIMGIAGSGLMMLSGNAVNHEHAAFKNDLAFLAAESGLNLGVSWLRDRNNWNDENPVLNNNPIYTGQINGMNVTVTLDVTNGIELQSEARDPDNYLKYSKKLSWGVQVIRAPNPGVFINNLNPLEWGVGQGGLNNTWFDGPFHANTPIHLSAVSNPRADGASVYFTGPVTTYNHTDKIHFKEGHWGHYGNGGTGNNYDFGILVKDGQSQDDPKVGEKLDNHFRSSFKHSQDSLYMPKVTGQDILLPLNQSPTKRAILYYQVSQSTGLGMAIYFYYDADGNLLKDTIPINNQLVRAQNEISVLGTVKGQTTLVTDDGFNIYPIGDLVYDDFVPDPEANYENYDHSNNFGVGTLDNGNTNIISLVSGADIHFERGNKKVMSDVAYGTLAEAPNDEEMYLTASLIAAEKGHGLMWDLNPVNGEFQTNDFNYLLRAIGSRTIDDYFSYEAGGDNANKRFRFYVDRRVLENLRGPDVPGLQSGNNNHPLFQLDQNWREENNRI